MEDTKKKPWTVRALAGRADASIEKLAQSCGINPSHLKMVSCGRATMTGHDLQLLSAFTGISADEIETRKIFYLKSQL